MPALWIRAESGFTPAHYPHYFRMRWQNGFKTHLPQVEHHKFAGTTHYTIVLGESAAAKIADLICELESRLRSPAKVKA